MFPNLFKAVHPLKYVLVSSRAPPSRNLTFSSKTRRHYAPVGFYNSPLGGPLEPRLGNTVLIGQIGIKLANWKKCQQHNLAYFPETQSQRIIQSANQNYFFSYLLCSRHAIHQGSANLFGPRARWVGVSSQIKLGPDSSLARGPDSVLYECTLVRPAGQLLCLSTRAIHAQRTSNSLPQKSTSKIQVPSKISGYWFLVTWIIVERRWVSYLLECSPNKTNKGT